MARMNHSFVSSFDKPRGRGRADYKFKGEFRTLAGFTKFPAGHRTIKVRYLWSSSRDTVASMKSILLSASCEQASGFLLSRTYTVSRKAL